MQPLAEIRNLVAARAAELQQSYLVTADSARHYDSVGDHLMGSVQWRRAHVEQVRLEEIERVYAMVCDLAQREPSASDLARTLAHDLTDAIPRQEARSLAAMRDYEQRDLVPAS